jgi:hypothetical protein
MDIRHAHNKFLQTFRLFCEIKGRSRGLPVEREGEALWKSHKNDLVSVAEQMRSWEESIAEIKKKSFTKSSKGFNINFAQFNY